MQEQMYLDRRRPGGQCRRLGGFDEVREVGVRGLEPGLEDEFDGGLGCLCSQGGGGCRCSGSSAFPVRPTSARCQSVVRQKPPEAENHKERADDDNSHPC
jgi:hypothetical protein